MVCARGKLEGALCGHHDFARDGLHDAVGGDFVKFDHPSIVTFDAGDLEIYIALVGERAEDSGHASGRPGLCPTLGEG